MRGGYWVILGAPFVCASGWVTFSMLRAMNSFSDGVMENGVKAAAEEFTGVYLSLEGTPRVFSDNYLPERELKESNYEDSGGYLLFHSYFEGGKLFPGYEYLIKGFLVTQNLAKTKFVMWITEDWRNASDPEKPYIVNKYRYHPNIEFRLLDKEHLVKGTCWESRPEFMEKKTIKTYGMRDYSNVVRWLILYNYGGIWLDADSIPIMDMSYLHEQNRDAVLVGYAPPTKEDLAAHADRPKELGMFNNNFIHLTDRAMKDKIMEVACEFRRKPLETGQKGYANEPFINVIPHVGSDNHELYVMNHWLFNDGTLRFCWIRDDCKLNRIDLGATDPIWVRTNDMYAICERVIQSMERYTASFTKLLKARNRENGLRKYIEELSVDDQVFIIHNRLSHCRTAGTVPMGMAKWFTDLLDAHLDGEDIMHAPQAPQSVLTFDEHEQLKPHHKIEYLPLIIVVESTAERVDERQMVRGLLRDNWFPDLFEAMGRLFKIFFVVPYDEKVNKVNAKLHAELYLHNDLILVDPIDPTKPLSNSSLVSPALRNGLLKILNGHDSRFMMLLFGAPKLFLHIRNLFYFLNVASGMSLFNKEAPVKSFIVTHKLTDSAEIGGDSTIFRQYKPGGQPQSFVIFTRDNLHLMIGATKPNRPELDDAEAEWAGPDEASYGGQPGSMSEFTKPPATMRHVFNRLPPHTSLDHIVHDSPVRGVAATMLETYNFYGSPFGSPSMEKFRTKAAALNEAQPACSLFENVPYESTLKPPQHPITDNAIIHMNVTAVWNVPCSAALYELRAAVETIPILLIK